MDGGRSVRDAEPLAMAIVCQASPKSSQRQRRSFRYESIPPQIIDHVTIVLR
jgi:hypothetical protein